MGFEDLPDGMKGHSLVHTSVPRERSRLFPNMLSGSGGASLLSFLLSYSDWPSVNLHCYLMKPTMRVSKPFRSEAVPGKDKAWGVVVEVGADVGWTEEVNSMRS